MSWSFYQQGGKRLLDVGVSAVALLVLLPLLVLIAAAIRIEDGGPALFRQRRAGRAGTAFILFKYRSMPVGSATVPSHEARALRVTRVGALLRRTNLDELPQLLNILRGEMSLVGPRPALPGQTELLALRTASGAMRCRPGLTGLAQIRSYDGMPTREKASLDSAYADRVTLGVDLGIILRTAGYLLHRPPVY